MNRANHNLSRLTLLAITICITLIVGTLVMAQFVPQQQETDTLRKLCTVQDAAINENSGIVLSFQNENTIWTHNDSGAEPIVYLFSQTTGKTLGTVSLTGAKNRDWEDISRFRNGDRDFIVLADVGDNLRKRERYQLLTFAEPKLAKPNHDDPTVEHFEIDSWQPINFQYEDGSHNCEAITVDFANRQVILMEKVYVEHDNVPGVYLIDLPEKINAKDVLTARRVADHPIKNITAMDMSSDSMRIIARTYFQGFLFTRVEDQSWEDAFTNNEPQPIAIPLQRQGEGICFSADDHAVFCSSEFRKAPIWQVELKENE